MIYVYDDKTWDRSIVFSQLRKDFGLAAVAACNAEDISRGILNPVMDMLVVPGGDDLNYCKDLNGRGTRIIMNFVRNGGGFLGLCAGSYFGSREISWAEGTDKEISGLRDMALVDCRAIGPVRDFIESVEGCWTNAVKVSFNEAAFYALYNGGPAFEANGNCDVLARYADLPGSPPSIVGNRYGKGYAVLCSPHLETSFGEFEARIYEKSPFFNRLSMIAPALRVSEENRKNAWIGMINLLLPC
jgi:glutamine amidotransferase-like uncharacterized protein